MERGLTLTDASAYNIQCLGPKPVFVDLLSLRPYQEGELWAGHRQFCEQFLGPLLLYMDAANPSPDQGWNQAERQGLAARANADGLLALAFVHHLASGRNIPLDEAVGWLMGLAPRGVIEFVPRDDPTVQTMLAHRDPDLFADYTQAAFVAALQRRGRIVAEERVSATGRHLYAYQRGD